MTSFDTCLAALTDGDMPRVWSLIVTIFGDMAQGEGETLSGQTINAITGTIGIKPEATRVALHRLKGDGWLWSERVGRGSDYGLTDQGRRESVSASPRIYGSDHPTVGWHLIIADLDSRNSLDRLIAARSHVQIGTCAVIGHGTPPKRQPGWLMLNGGALAADEIPDWVKSALCSDDQIRASQDLRDRFARVLAALPAKLTPCEAVALRVLIVHAWRRLVLRTPNLPLVLFPGDWAAPACADTMRRILDQLPKPSPAVISAR